MGGAYVAKPDAVSTPDVPDGWNIDWPFPGPFPPGFDPELNDWPGEGEPSDCDNPDDNISIVAFPYAGLETDESGGEATIGIFLTGRNNSPVTVPVFPGIEGEFVVNVWGEIGEVEFDADETYKSKLITVRGKNDGIIDGDTLTTLIIGPSDSSNPDYNNLFAAPLPITNKEIVNKIVFGLTITGYTADYTEEFEDCEDEVEILAFIDGSGDENGNVSGYKIFSHSNGEVTGTEISSGKARMEVEFDVQSYDIRITATNLSDNGIYNIVAMIYIASCKKILSSHANIRLHCRFFHNDIVLEDCGVVNLSASSGEMLTYHWLSLDQSKTTPLEKLLKLEETYIEEFECDECGPIE